MAVSEENRRKLLRHVLQRAERMGLVSVNIDIESAVGELLPDVNISKYLSTSSHRYDEKDMVKVTRQSSGKRRVTYRRKSTATPL